MKIKIIKLLIKIEKWALEKCIGKDASEYEEYAFAIQKHEKEIERIDKAGGTNAE